MVRSYLLWGIIVLGGLFRKTSIEKSFQRKIYIFIVSVAMILYMGLRGDCYTDYSLMLGIYKIVSKCSLSSIFTLDFHLNTEGIGFALLMRFCYYVFGSLPGQLAFMIITSILIVLPLSCVVYKYSAYPYISFLVYITIGTFFEGFNITQQMVAASLAFLGMVIFRYKSKVIGLIFLTMSVLFHISAIIMIGYLLVSKIKSQAKQLILIIVGLAAAFNASRLASLFGLIVYKKQYALTSHYDLSAVGVPLIIAVFFVTLFFISNNRLGLYVENYESERLEQTQVKFSTISMNFWINGTITWGIFLVFKLFVALATRFASFFMPFTLISIPNMLRENAFTSKSKTIVRIVFVWSMSFFYLYVASRVVWKYVSIFG